MLRYAKAWGSGRSYPGTYWLALAANVFFCFSFQCSLPVLPRYIAEVVLNQPPESVGGHVGLAATAYAFGAVCTRIPAGQLADRFGRRPLLFVGAICFVVAPLTYAVSRGMPILLLGRIVQGMGWGIFNTAFMAFVADLAPVGRRGEAMGMAGASMWAAFISAPLIGDWLALNWGYMSLLMVSVAIATVSVVLVAFISALPGQRSARCVPAITRRSDASQGSKGIDTPKLSAWVGLRMALTQKGVRAGVLTMAAGGVPLAAFFVFLPLFAEQQLNTGVGAVYSIYAATVFLAQPLAGWLADRVSWRDIILPGLFITGLAAGITAIDGSLAVLVFAGIAFGLGVGLARGGADPLVQGGIQSSLRGTAAAVQYTSHDLSFAASSYPIGLLANAVGYAVAFAVTGIICVLGGGGVAVMLREAGKAPK